MATTSPDNIWTPDSGDQYALTQDLGANADSVQAALIRRGNLYVGTSSQRVAFTAATPGVNWQDTDGAQAKYVRTTSGWLMLGEKFYSGTSSQRTAFTDAPNGSHWQDTDSPWLEWRREGASWRALNPRLSLPSSVNTVGGSYTVSPTGTVSFTGVSSVSLNGVFSSDASKYIVSWDVSTSRLATLGFALRGSGADVRTGYSGSRIYQTGATGGNQLQVGETLMGLTPNTAQYFYGTARVLNPASSSSTHMSRSAFYTRSASDGSTSGQEQGPTVNTLSASHDGLSLIISTGTATGSIVVERVA